MIEKLLSVRVVFSILTALLKFFNSRKHTPVKWASTLCHLEKVSFLAINGGYVNRFQTYFMYLQARHLQPKARCVAAKFRISENLLESQVSVK